MGSFVHILRQHFSTGSFEDSLLALCWLPCIVHGGDSAGFKGLHIRLWLFVYEGVYVYVCVDICLCVCTFAHGFVNVFSYMSIFLCHLACVRSWCCVYCVYTPRRFTNTA